MFRDASSNREAREDFMKAGVLATEGRRRDEEGRSGAGNGSGGVPTPWARLEGLASLGVARTLSQDRHRYGIRDADTVKEARKAAGHAVTLLDRSAESLYALAFAWHCTETLEDIEKGIEVYREIIRREPRKHPGVHNNLGYILMVGGERLRDRGDEAGAREWWKRAEKEIRLTLRISDETRVTTPFSRANLGNLHRLRGRYAEAEREYLRSLGPDPRESRYTNGLNELARLYVEMGRTEDAFAFHTLALASTDDSNQRRKLEEDFALARAPTQAPG
jgi:tetratricopeptide (TPR) repeat protein